MTFDTSLSIGSVTLGVADLALQTDFYRSVIGLEMLAHFPAETILGAGSRPLVRLEARPEGVLHPRAPGLFHLALLVPSRNDLGHWLQHLIDNGYPLEGAGDHLVSEALYLRDSEGNGIEIYYDRPKDAWEYKAGSIKMATLPVDYRSLLAQAPKTRYSTLPDGTTMGHMHLQVDALEPNLAFYRDILGFDLMARWPGAYFLSTGGYHHHIGLNTWQSKGVERAPEGSLGLIRYELVAATTGVRDRLMERSALQASVTGEEPVLQDPAGNVIELKVA